MNCKCGMEVKVGDMSCPRCGSFDTVPQPSFAVNNVLFRKRLFSCDIDLVKLVLDALNHESAQDIFKLGDDIVITVADDTGVIADLVVNDDGNCFVAEVLIDSRGGGQ